MIQKTVLFLLRDINLFKILEKIIVLSNCILSSKWPRFVVPIHSGHAVCLSTLILPECLKQVLVGASLKNIRFLEYFSSQKSYIAFLK